MQPVESGPNQGHHVCGHRARVLVAELLARLVVERHAVTARVQHHQDRAPGGRVAPVEDRTGHLETAAFRGKRNVNKTQRQQGGFQAKARFIISTRLGPIHSIRERESQFL